MEEEEASFTSSMLAEEEEEFKRCWQRHVSKPCWQQWQDGSVVAAGAQMPDRLLSEEDLKPGEVEFESMEAARNAIRNFCWSSSVVPFLCPPVRPQTVCS
jgi:hypothetical protein